jgi:ABC-type antimicrobial peptide transport system permease subunit
LLLGTIGIYGVLSHTVRSRTAEVGVRIALGAQYHDVMTIVIRPALLTVGLGIVAGLTLAAGLTRSLKALLFGIEPLDAVTFAGATLTLIVAAALASYLPARRAALVDPLTALRHD